MKDEASIALTHKKTIGNYATDEQGDPWASFCLHNHTYPCAVCGKQIKAGWVRGKVGEEAMYVCSEHVQTRQQSEA